MKSILFILCLASLGCNIPKPGKIKNLPSNTRLVHDTTIGSGGYAITAQYLGCGGVYLIKEGEGILIDPFFSNQNVVSVLKAAVGNKKKIVSDKKMVEAGWRHICRHDSARTNIRAIFVAHGHYDHLLDVPAVWHKLHNKPKVYLNRSGYNTCYNVVPPQNMVILEDSMSTPERENEPFVLQSMNGNKIKVYPILAQHNPHVGHIKAFDGAVVNPVDSFTTPYKKTHGNDWLEGNTFSFLIDYLNSEDSIELRVFVQSSSCNPNAGFPPKRLLGKKQIDVAFLGVSSYGASPHYPDSLLNTIHSKNIVWIHWEDFFRKYTKPAKTVRGTDVPCFFNQLCKKQHTQNWCTPYPGSILTIEYDRRLH